MKMLLWTGVTRWGGFVDIVAAAKAFNVNEKEDIPKTVRPLLKDNDRTVNTSSTSDCRKQRRRPRRRARGRGAKIAKAAHLKTAATKCSRVHTPNAKFRDGKTKVVGNVPVCVTTARKSDVGCSDSNRCPDGSKCVAYEKGDSTGILVESAKRKGRQRFVCFGHFYCSPRCSA
uniref:AWS domain-containing protein n=1 Tax=Globodera pallida TaxID=36090 RepID=A0A183C6Y4_GLOPA